jgi:hypothetical protein
MVGAVTGVIAVVSAGSVIPGVIPPGLGMATGLGIAGLAGALIGQGVSGRGAAASGGLGGAAGGLAGAFFAVASREVYQGLEWTVYGGLIGVATAATCGALLALLAASVGGALRIKRFPFSKSP